MGKAYRERESIRIANIMASWIRYVRNVAPDYAKKCGDSQGNSWPTEADVLHSSLLKRMLTGEQPLSDNEYREKHDKGLV